MQSSPVSSYASKLTQIHTRSRSTPTPDPLRSRSTLDPLSSKPLPLGLGGMATPNIKVYHNGMDFYIYKYFSQKYRQTVSMHVNL